MLKDITLGQYYPVESPIHRLDPRTKLLGTLIFIISLFIAKGIFGYLLATAFLAACIAISGVPFHYMMKGLKPIFILLLFSVVFNLFLVPGTVLVKFLFLQITREGLEQAGYMTIRLVYLVTGSSLMTFTTTPTSLTDGLERGLHFLNYIHIPVHEIAMMMSIALRFIPILTEEADKIMKAQMARGADFESGSLMRRVKSLIPLLVPLFISAFRRATDLAMAMEARCYHGGSGRTKMYPLRYKREDYVAYGLIFLFLAALIFLRYFL